MWPVTVRAQTSQLVDRLVAIVGGQPLTLTDLRFARGVGAIVVPEAADDAAAIAALVDRRLLVLETARLPPREPAADLIEAEVQRMRAHAGTGLSALLRDTGYTERSLADTARETLRIDAYLSQRYGAGTTRASAEARQLLADLRARTPLQIAGAPR